MRFKYLLFFVLASVLLLSSCKGKNKKQNDNTKPGTEVVNNNNGVSKPGSALTSANDPMLLKAKDIYNAQDTFSTVEIKFDMSVSLPDKNISGSGQLRIDSGKQMWLFLKVLGFEAGRVLFTPDSVKAVVPLKKAYFKGDYQYLKNFFPVDIDFDILQSIFLDKFFLFPNNNPDNLTYFKYTEEGSNMTLSTFDFSDYSTKFGIDDCIKLNTATKRMTENYAMIAKQNKGLKIQYAEVEDFGGHLLPKEVKFEGVGTNFTVVFSYNKATFGKNLSFPLNIPNNYTPFKL